MRVLVAPDKFKGSLTAAEVADHLAAGLRTIPGTHVTTLPLADGGDGSVEAAVTAGFRPIAIDTVGPTGTPHSAVTAYDGHTVLVEVANTCGIALLPQGTLQRLRSSSYGFGLAVAHALTLQPSRLVLALGGSASTDGGLGMLVALGAKAYDRTGVPLRGGGQDLTRLDTLDLSPLPNLDDCDIVIATDVNSWASPTATT